MWSHKKHLHLDRSKIRSRSNVLGGKIKGHHWSIAFSVFWRFRVLHAEWKVFTKSWLTDKCQISHHGSSAASMFHHFGHVTHKPVVISGPRFSLTFLWIRFLFSWSRASFPLSPTNDKSEKTEQSSNLGPAEHLKALSPVLDLNM